MVNKYDVCDWNVDDKGNEYVFKYRNLCGSHVASQAAHTETVDRLHNLK